MNSDDLGYTAPEVIEGDIYDTKADIYSLANILLDLININK
jgi:serine/threonine protein kinase